LARSGSGSTFSAIVREQIEAISFPLPTPDEQRIIVTRLEAQMAEVQRLRQAAERQLEAARALFGALLRRVFRYKEGDPLPAGWRWVRLGEISAKRVDTCSPKEKFLDTFIYVDISSIDNVQKRIVSPQVLPAREAPSRARQIIKTGDILVATTRPNLNGVALVPPELDNQICSTGFCVLRIPDENLARLVFAYVQSPTFVAIVSRLVQGALYPAITDDDVKKCWMPLPSPEEWHTIVARLEAQVAEVQRLRKAAERQLEAIHALPGALLGEVFGGYELGPGD